MSVDMPPPDDVDPAERFELAHEGEVWVAIHLPSGIASQGADPTEAVEMAREAVALHDADHEPGDDAFQREMLERCGIDPDEVLEEIKSPDGMP